MVLINKLISMLSFQKYNHNQQLYAAYKVDKKWTEMPQIGRIVTFKFILKF